MSMMWKRTMLMPSLAIRAAIFAASGLRGMFALKARSTPEKRMRSSPAWRCPSSPTRTCPNLPAGFWSQPLRSVIPGVASSQGKTNGNSASPAPPRPPLHAIIKAHAAAQRIAARQRITRDSSVLPTRLP